MIIEPFSQYVIIQLDPADKLVGNSGLLAPGAMMEKYDVPKRTGTVKAVGRGLVTAGGAIIDMQSKPGDRVYVIDSAKNVEISIEFNGEKCIVLSDESHIIGRIKNESSLITEGF